MSSVFVYRTFDRDGSLLYVGCTNNVGRRIDQHLRKGTGGGDAITDYTAQEYPDRAAGLAAEARAILAEQPSINVRGKLRRGVDLATAGDPAGNWSERLTWRLAQQMIGADVGVVGLARECGIPLTRLSRAFALCNFRVDDLYLISQALGITVTDLVKGAAA